MIVYSNETKSKIETAEFALAESNKKLKTIQAESVLLKNKLKMKKDQLKQKNTTLESVKSKLDKNMKDHENSRDNFNNKILNLETQNEHLKKNIDEKKLEIKNLKARQRLQEKGSNKVTQTDENEMSKTATIDTQTSSTEMSDKGTETLLKNLEIDSDIEHLFSGFCKETLRQFGKVNLGKSHVRLFVYTGDEDDIVATSDYYADYAKALDIMIDQEDFGDEIHSEDGTTSDN